MSYADSPTSPLPSPLHSPVMNHFPHAIQVWHLFSFSFFLLSLSYFLTCSFPTSFLSFLFLPFPFISFLLAVLWSASIFFFYSKFIHPCTHLFHLMRHILSDQPILWQTMRESVQRYLSQILGNHVQKMNFTISSQGTTWRGANPRRRYIKSMLKFLLFLEHRVLEG